MFIKSYNFGAGISSINKFNDCTHVMCDNILVLYTVYKKMTETYKMQEHYSIWQKIKSRKRTKICQLRYSGIILNVSHFLSISLLIILAVINWLTGSVFLL